MKVLAATGLCIAALVEGTAAFAPVLFPSGGLSPALPSRHATARISSLRMATECDPNNMMGALTDVDRGQDGEIIRDYTVPQDVEWRFGKPDYTKVNKLYFEGRSKKHDADSLEGVVQKIVKNWEVESHHMPNYEQWTTMDVKKFKAFANGAGPVSAEAMATVGPYNMLMGEMPSCPFSAAKETFESANKKFTGLFTEGFAWEVLEVYSGPPNVSFSWRHFGPAKGQFDGVKGDGEMIEMWGHTMARVNADLQIEELQVHYDRESFGSQLTRGEKATGVRAFLRRLINQ
mmetsp:Transcript_7571/g.18401  ORF Transcript_7571/g.18401 Transcript_7571/m.18401 type:complete len:289 (+) Transcript_7571:64-930(+)|eukprot:CAMPEP_0173438600 /NCGR_PEP_ID=MMETSP1357-20121228/20498_1 /TAXON_ID=77926 /ORGANISM="Hemiselmis rufescens, Strain PCC563" /LENGTH=288 /DNA_ID=CAMNT_0014403903 /DNA_START=56 /DNA_END=922 /DNA_ORIENTATION=+